MQGITYNMDPTMFRNNGVRISEKANNAFYIRDGMICFHEGTSTNDRNSAGNGFDLSASQGLPSVIRLNPTVTRKVLGDPDPSNEGPLVSDFITGFLGTLPVQEGGEE